MKNIIFILLLFLISCSKRNDIVAIVVPPQNNTTNNVINPDLNQKNPNKPINGEIGGIDYAYWNFNSQTFTKLVHTFTIYDEPSNKDGLYYQFYQGVLNDTIGFYYGIQTNVMGIGKKGIIFSRWKTRDTSNYITAPTGWGVSSGAEGDYIGVRKAYEWTVGSYTIEIRKDSSDNKGDWYGLWITALSNSKIDYLGSIRFERSNRSIGIKNNGITWTELYTKADMNTPLPKWHVSVDSVKADDQLANSVWVEYSKNKFLTFSNIYTTNRKDVHFSMGPEVLNVIPPTKLW